jgi:hypothetical protein
MSWRLFSGRQVVLSLLVLVVLGAMPGCVTRVQTGQIAPFRTGVATVSQQTQQSFTEVNSAVRATQVEVAGNADALREINFAGPLSAEDTAKWARAFSDIQAYADALQELLSDEQRKSVEEQLQKLGLQFQQRVDPELPPGLAAAFQKLGGLLVQQYAQYRAIEVVRNVDPAVQDIFRGLADALGATPDAGVRGTVRASWNTRLAEIEANFRKIALEKPRTSVTDKRALAEQYVAMLDLRSQQDLALMSVRTSTLALADAHAALAKGDEPSAASLIQIVRDEYEGYKVAKEQFEKLRDAARGKEKK